MKVYVKKGKSEGKNVHYVAMMSILTVILLMAILVLPSIISEVTDVFSYMFSDYDTFIEVITEYGFSFLLAITFGGIFLFLYLAIIYVFIKQPKEFKAKLVSKENDTYNEKEISYMKFAINNNEVITGTPLTYRCFTYGDNEFIEGNYYTIKIKELNYKIREVDILKENIENKPVKVSIFPIFLAILFVFGGGLIMASLRLDYCIRNNLKAWDNLPAIIIFSIFVITDIWVYWNFKHSDKED